jgi:hypothetical protein
MRAQEFIPERKKKKSSRSTGGYFFPGYGYYGSGESGEGGGDGGGESVDRDMAEGATVTRIDSKPVTDFASGLKAYKHTDNWSQSGLDTGDDSYWKNKNLKTNTTKGLFAGDPRRTALYATGNAHETRYVEFTQNGQPIVYFDQKDLPAMRSRKTYLTVFDASDFRQLPTGEWFSENPGKPIKQVPIGDPFKYIASQGWIVRVTDDLDKVFKQVKNMHKAGKIAQYGAEGMNESQQGVAEGKEKNHWHDAGVKDATRGARPNPRTYLPTLKDKQAKHPEEVDFYMNGYKSVKQGVAEASEEAEKYRAQLLKTAPRVMDFLAKTVKGWRPSEQEMLGAIDTAYTVMKHTGDVKQAGKAMVDELNTLHRMSQGQSGMTENFADGRNPQDKGDAKRHGINTKASVSSLRKTAKQGGRKGQLAHWLANMKSGRAKKK